MDIIAQKADARNRMMKYLKTHGVTETAIRYGVSRKTVYKWQKRYDGKASSLRDRSRKPHHVARKQTDEELALVKNIWSKDKKGDKLIMWQKAIEKHEYKRCYQTFLRTIRGFEGKLKEKRSQRKPQPYQRAEYPGQKLQLDVKFVPSYCVTDGNKYYQYTAIDECTRYTYRQMYNEHSTYCAKQFLDELYAHIKFPIREIQTDNGTEWTNALISVKAEHKTMFEEALAENGILYHRIRIATPRHNGKVERQHRKDQQRFYRKLKMYSLADGRKQLAAYQNKSNKYISSVLNMRSPEEVLDDYLALF
jgi:transposase-like protein